MKSLRTMGFLSGVIAAAVLASCQATAPKQDRSISNGAPEQKTSATAVKTSSVAKPPKPEDLKKMSPAEQLRAFNEREFNRRYNTVTDTHGCKAQIANLYRNAVSTWRFMHNCQGGVAQGDGWAVAGDAQGYPLAAEHLRITHGLEDGRRDKNRPNNWEPRYEEDRDRNILEALAGPDALAPDSLGAALLTALLEADARGSARAKASLAYLADNGAPQTLDRIKLFVTQWQGDKPDAHPLQQRLAQRSQPNAAQCDTAALETFMSDYLSVHRHMVLKGEQKYDQLALYAQEQLMKEARKDAMQRDLKEAQASQSAEKIRPWLRSAKNAPPPPMLECGFNTRYIKRYKSLGGTSETYESFDKNGAISGRLKLPVSGDWLGGANLAVRSVRVSHPTHVWVQQAREKTGVDLQPDYFASRGTRQFSYPVESSTGWVVIEPITPAQMRNIVGIAEAAQGRLGVKTWGLPTPFLETQQVERVLIFNPDKPDQQVNLPGASMKPY